MKTFVIGDIHSRYKALKQVFERSEFDKEKDTLIFVGDIVDRGEEPLECIEELLGVKNLIAIEGNHDWNFNNWIQTSKDMLNGHHGVSITKKIWRAEKDEEKKRWYAEYFMKTKPYYIDSKNRIFTHGGFDTEHKVESQNSFTLSWDRDLWERAMAYPKGESIKTVDNFTEIYIGHTPTINWGRNEEKSANGIIITVGVPITYPMFMGGVWNMDTGAGFDHGKLSMMNIDTKEIFQSDRIEDLYKIH